MAIINPGIRNFDPIVYDAVGKCIYCGSSGPPLTNEHIIPFSLGGIMILPKSSCKRCSTITGKFEGTVARSIFGNFRMRHNLPSRRKDKRPSLIETHRSDDANKKIFIPVNEYPAPLFLMKALRAGFLQGFPKELDTSGSWQMIAVSSNTEMKEFSEKYGNAVFSFRHSPVEFTKMIAKICYSYAVGILGYGTFEPVIQNFILGKEKNISHYVGGDLDIAPQVKGAGHLLQLEGILANGILTIVVEVRLFASNSTPTYHAVVGQITSPNEINKFFGTHKDKFGTFEIISP